MDAADPDRAVIQVSSCELTAIDVEGAVLRAEVRTRAGSVQASLSGVLVVMDDPGASTTICQVKRKRIDLGAATPACVL